HRRALVRVKADALPGGDQRVHPARGQLQHQTPADQHHEDLLLESDRAAAEPAAVLRRRDPRGTDQLVDQILVTLLGLRLLVHPPRLDPASYSRHRAAAGRGWPAAGGAAETGVAHLPTRHRFWPDESTGEHVIACLTVL